MSRAVVRNIRTHVPQDGDVYIGRAGHGHDGYFGNPIRRGTPCPVCRAVHQRGGATLVCFEQYARARLTTDEVYRTRVAALHGRNLICFCAPGPCHGDTLALLAEELQSSTETPCPRST